jgi:hypothetical protein
MNKVLAVASAALLMAGCGGGGDALMPADDATGTINIAITDAAVDDVSEVWVEFTGITLKPEQGDEIVFTFDPQKTINLLDLQDGKTEELLPDTRVAVGRYNWMRLAVNAEFDNVMDSYAVRNGSAVELRVPSGSQSGLKLVSGFTVTQNMSTNMVIDWDLRKALSDPQGQPGMHLRPALRVTDMAVYGTLRGAVDEVLTMADDCGEDATVGNAVYLYEGAVEDPLDIRGVETDPVATATVESDLTYSINYLSVGDYTAAFTCQADLDNVGEEDDLVFSVVNTEVTIVDGETTIVDFAAPAT